MKTDDLIAVLALESRGPGPGRLRRQIALWSGLGALAAAGVVVVAMGARADLMQGPGLANFIGKAGYTLALAVVGLWLLDRLGRPGARARRAWMAFILLTVGGLAAAGVDLALTPAGARYAQLMGQSALICPLAILILSLFTLAPAMLAARGFAPLKPAAAGAATGLLAGGLAATAYGLHCSETAVSFLVVWYGLGVLATGALGAMIGARLLRW
ncbi:DUF1109 domain-containing protein [Phenylobacterium sp.]|uniref:DUF1109 domain-containing protein n=1 Tax=Phenylobacterium sp. TaxID=1871053 RepID=UPI002730F4F6|nr:DUF1109 domain-containing protein [Phenylobacterium sp.]MDP1873229.1 DUF1109 domain-containing protein [Phenylobacterium sp.]